MTGCGEPHPGIQGNTIGEGHFLHWRIEHKRRMRISKIICNISRHPKTFWNPIKKYQFN